MLLFDDKKRAITTILGRRSAKGERLSGPAPMQAQIVKSEGGEVDGTHVASQDMMAAIHEKNPQKFSEALKNFHDLYTTHAPSQEPKKE